MLFIIFIRVGPLTSFKTYKQQQKKYPTSLNVQYFIAAIATYFTV